MSEEEYDSDMEVSEDDGNFAEYYNITDGDYEAIDPSKTDPEYFQYECLDIDQVRHMLNVAIDNLSNNLQITPSLAKILLHTHEWAIPAIAVKYRDDGARQAMMAKIEPRPEAASAGPPDRAQRACNVCTALLGADQFHRLACGHPFCRDCWTTYCEIKINQGVSTAISCMAQECEVLAPEDFVQRLIKCHLKDKYQTFAFQDYVRSHPQLRFCPGANCSVVVCAKEPVAKRVTCLSCRTVFCFRCGIDYHAPTDCVTIKRWLTKCADDSETANYISAHTKDCPKCNICIEKNGGCNHMQCYSCKHDFCWMCLGDWKTHGSEYYECSRYKDNPNIASQSAHAQAREALKKYLHYYERWENHSKSLMLEQETLEKIKARINTKVMSASGTWIDWQYLLDAATLLVKCRYTLQYTYPYAYYLAQSKKSLFEYQQMRLEAEIENLSWKIERAETTDRADLENQMDIAEKRRTTLLKEFLVI